MKKRITFLVLLLILIVVGMYFFFTSKNEVAIEVEQPSASEYEERVEVKMTQTALEWEKKHRLWSEQEVSKEIIAEQEQRLQMLRETEVSSF